MRKSLAGKPLSEGCYLPLMCLSWASRDTEISLLPPSGCLTRTRKKEPYRLSTRPCSTSEDSEPLSASICERYSSKGLVVENGYIANGNGRHCWPIPWRASAPSAPWNDVS